MAPIAYEDLEVDEDGAGDGMENDGEPRGQADQQTEEQVISKDTLNIYKVLWYIQHLLSIYIDFVFRWTNKIYAYRVFMNSVFITKNFCNLALTSTWQLLVVQKIARQ